MAQAHMAGDCEGSGVTIDEHICSGGVATIPDLRGNKECYSDSTPFESLVITQVPEPGSLVDAGQTVINVLTEDGNGNATICTHYLNVTADNPAPTLECPEPITSWLLAGGVEVPDYTKVVDIIGGCTVYDELIITQSPEAGSLLTTAGVHTITISVTDKFGHTVVCGETTITITDPNPMVNPPVAPPVPPVVTPSYIYQSNLFAYWKLDIHSFLTDYGPGARTLTNNGASSQVVTGVVCNDCGPGPLFRCGSAYFNQTNSYLSYPVAPVDALRLMGTSFTIRILIKLVQLASPVCFFPLGSAHAFDGRGYKLIICDGPYVQAQLANVTDTLLTPAGAVPMSMNVWQQVAVTFDIATGSMKLYVDGSLGNTQTLPGFTVGDGLTTQFVIGPTINGEGVEAYIDEVGIWTEAWSASRLMEDFNLLNCN